VRLIRRKMPDNLEKVVSSSSGGGANSGHSDISLTIDTPPEEKLEALKRAAKHFNAGMCSIICRDKNDKLLSVSIYAEGDDAAALEKWLKRREKRDRKTVKAGRA
jgi:hypothetical protein